MRKYWIHFKIVDGQKAGEGYMEVEREFAIRGEMDLREIGAAIKQSLGTSLPPTANLQVTGWQAFEEERILTATSLPPSKQSQQISLSH